MAKSECTKIRKETNGNRALTYTRNIPDIDRNTILVNRKATFWMVTLPVRLGVTTKNKVCKCKNFHVPSFSACPPLTTHTHKTCRNMH